MKLEAKIGTLKFSFENDKDLLSKIIKEKEQLEKQAKEFQIEWEKVEKTFKDKMKPIRKNIMALQDAVKSMTPKSESEKTKEKVKVETKPDEKIDEQPIAE